MARDVLLEKAKALTGLCECGRMHSLSTKDVYIGKDIEERLAFYAMDLAGGGSALAVFDHNTYAAMGERVMSTLQRACGGADRLLLCGEEIHADAGSVGDILLHVGDNTRLLVAVGSGTINDSCRYVSHRLKLPYIVVGTAPSMDGYASSVSPVIMDGLKLTIEACSPGAVLLDPGVLARAPKPMLAAGLGDMLGKHIALLDWELAHSLTGERYCAPIASLMREAVRLCEESADGLSTGDEGAVAALGRGLCLSGLAMQLMGNSRPASGGEHHISHFLELKQMQRGEKPSLHGDKVGVATLYMIEFYHKLFEKKRPLRPVDLASWEERLRENYGPAAEGFLAISPLDRQESTPLSAQYENYLRNFDAFKQKADELYAKKEEYRRQLCVCQGPVEPEQLGVSREDFKRAMLCAFLLRPRYASLRMAFYFGWLEEITDEIFA